MAEAKPQAIGPYIIQSVLGEGTTGKVKLAYHKDTGQQVAIKIISKSSFDQKPNLHTKVQRETALMRVVDHPNILKLYDVLESHRHLCMILEYAQNGELFDFLVVRRCLPVDMAIDFFRQIVLSIEYLHVHGICHRDLKPENILLDAHNRIKIADFGFARWVKTRVTETSCGSPHYAAPEVIRGIPYDGRKADIWSLGVILYALLAGYLPFDDPSIRVVLHKVKKGVYEMPQFPTDIQDLIQRLIVVDPNQRLTIEQIKAHPCFRRDLESSYQLPYPIPNITDEGSLDPKDLSPSILRVLTQIGFSDEELNQQLQEQGNTMAKVFISMLTAKLDLVQLPWDEESNYAGKMSNNQSVSKDQLDANSFMKTATTTKPKPSAQGENGQIEIDDPFHRHKERVKIQQSLDVHSMAIRPNWLMCDDDPNSAMESLVVKTNSKCFYGKKIWYIMSRCQNASNDFGLQWFHPNPMIMYCRMQDSSFYISVISSFKELDEINIQVRLHKGETAVFDDFCDKLFNSIDEVALF